MRHFPARRIGCLTEETVETLYLLGEQDRIVGVSGYAVRRRKAGAKSRASLRPLYGTKRTSASAAPMSPNDPKRTSLGRLLI